MQNQPWHLRKEVTITFILALMLYFVSAVYAYANIERDIEENTQGRKDMTEQMNQINNGVQDIREGLISKGIIHIK